MKYLRLSFLTLLVTVFINCSKGGNNDNPPAGTPADLNVTFEINADNSGNVSFSSTAVNAVSYEYDFGNGYYQSTDSGALTYKYPVSGTYTVKVTAKGSSGKAVSKTVQVAVAVVSTLVWSDEFNTSGAPDPAKWGYDLGAGGWGNNELQYYTNRADNVIVSNGTLKITAKKENYSGSAYTSARLLSKGKFSFKYGKVEIRAKLPSGGGTWPALWMLGENIDTTPWPDCGEIDIMEHKGNDLNKIFGTLHYPGHSGGNANGTTTVINNATTEFHIYTLDWTASSIRISVDNNTFFTFQNNNGVPFNQKFFLILNLAIGGTFGGTVDPAFTNGTMEVDYVRVYQ